MAPPHDTIEPFSEGHVRACARLFAEVGLSATPAPRTIEGITYDSFVGLRAAP